MVLQKAIPYDPLVEVSLPGIAPLPANEWITVDEAYEGQMALRESLLHTRLQDVHAILPAAFAAAHELLEQVLKVIADMGGFELTRDQVTCPDGRVVNLNWDAPLVTVAQLVQEDMCILERRGDEHVLTGAVLCFPASWSLSEKFDKPLTGIHSPVVDYDQNIARRVQRLFDGVRAGRPIWRKNVLWYDDPSLFQPRKEADRRAPVSSEGGAFLRSEKQSILRLPNSDAVVFSIHTYVLARADVAQFIRPKAIEP
ncbi:heme-dependent oxidative N-demethylase family protein [Shimia abyssi]|uniref:heme-dependent oxidative N-demethylase family protein n=1 Tax=Shimia abyssi TaxID=1662395 RepID=UPI001FB04631|nr:DUF3445 domain-containing protein [Shimia abyssi]